MSNWLKHRNNSQNSNFKSYHIDLPSFINIKANLYLFSVNIHAGTDYQATVYDKDQSRISFSVEDQTLFIKEKDENRKQKNIHLSDIPKLIITIPNGTSLDSVKIGNNVSDINLAGFSMRQLDLYLSAGSLQLTEITVKDRAKVILEAGSLSISHCKTNLNATLSAGSVKIEQLRGNNHFELAAGSLKATTDDDQETEYNLTTVVGSINYHGHRKLHHFYREGAGKDYLTVQSAVGSIKII